MRILRKRATSTPKHVVEVPKNVMRVLLKTRCTDNGDSPNRFRGPREHAALNTFWGLWEHAAETNRTTLQRPRKYVATTVYTHCRDNRNTLRGPFKQVLGIPRNPLRLSQWDQRRRIAKIYPRGKKFTFLEPPWRAVWGPPRILFQDSSYRGEGKLMYNGPFAMFLFQDWISECRFWYDTCWIKQIPT